MIRDRLRNPEYVRKNRWLTLLVLCMSLMIIGLDNTILNVALPTLARPHSLGGLSASGSQLQWVVDSYVIVFAGLLLSAGSLGDRFGRYRCLALGLGVFGLGSVLSAFASSASTLIGTRALMGVGAAFIMPATLSIITNVFHDPRERAKAIGVWAGVSAIGIASGPLLGGALLEHFWWGSVFLVNVPVVATALVLGYVLIPDSRDPSAPKLDALGSLLSIVGLATLLWGIIEAPGQGWGSPEVLTAFAVGGLVVIAFVLWELHSKHPMLDVRVFENPRFSAASGAITLTFLALFGTIFLLTQYMQLVLGYSTLKVGAVLLPHAVVLMVLAPLSPRWVHRFGSKRVIATGMVIASFGLLLMATFTVHSSTLSVIVIMMVLASGFAQILAPATESIMGSLPREKAGVGSAMNDTTRQIGGAIGVAVFGSIVASTYRSEMSSALDGKVRPGVLDAASDSVGAAIGAARNLAAPAASRVVEAAQASFVSGFHVAVIVGAAIVLLGALGVLRWLPARVNEEPPESIPTAGAQLNAREPEPGYEVPRPAVTTRFEDGLPLQ
ncbi:MAG: MFS transporter [Acidimicrobiia bacterium]